VAPGVPTVTLHFRHLFVLTLEFLDFFGKFVDDVLGFGLFFWLLILFFIIIFIIFVLRLLTQLPLLSFHLLFLFPLLFLLIFKLFRVQYYWLISFE
jgi:hypothetical protein